MPTSFAHFALLIFGLISGLLVGLVVFRFWLKYYSNKSTLMIKRTMSDTESANAVSIGMNSAQTNYVNTMTAKEGSNVTPLFENKANGLPEFDIAKNAQSNETLGHSNSPETKNIIKLRDAISQKTKNLSNAEDASNKGDRPISNIDDSDVESSDVSRSDTESSDAEGSDADNIGPKQNLEKMKELIEHSLTDLEGNFESIHNETHRQESLISQLGKSTEKLDPINDRRKPMAPANIAVDKFMGDVNHVLTYYINLIISVSQQSTDTIKKIDAMIVQMDGIFDMVADVRAIADQTSLLALNASIDAVKSGDAGRGFSFVAHEVIKLSKQSEEFSHDIRTEVDAAKETVSQARDLVSNIAENDLAMAVNTKAKTDKLQGKLVELCELLSSELASSELGSCPDEESIDHSDATKRLVDRSKLVISEIKETLALLQVKLQALSSKDILSDSDKLDLSQMLLSIESLRLAKIHHKITISGVETGEISLF